MSDDQFILFYGDRKKLISIIISLASSYKKFNRLPVEQQQYISGFGEANQDFFENHTKYVNVFKRQLYVIDHRPSFKLVDSGMTFGDIKLYNPVLEEEDEMLFLLLT